MADFHARSMKTDGSRRLADVAHELEVMLTRGAIPPARFTPEQVARRTVFVSMRDGIRLATDLYLPPLLPAPAIAIRTPYKRAVYAQTFMACAQRGYVVIAQDCRGTGDSEPETWDFDIYEAEDSLDFV